MFVFALGLATSVLQTPKADISYVNKAFEIRSGSQKETIVPAPLPSPKSQTETTINFRKDQTFVVWDSRGLSVRVGEKLLNTRFASFLLDSKLNSPTEIARHRYLIQAGKMKSGASKVVAARRFGNDTFWVLRWEDSAGRPVVEAFVTVSLIAKEPTVQVLARLRGRYPADGPIADRLPILGDKITLVEADESKWGLIKWDPKTKRLSRIGMGQKLLSIDRMSSRLFAFTERTSQGSQVLGRADFIAEARKDLLETSGEVALLDPASPWIAHVIENGSAHLQNLESGSKTPLAADSYAIRGKLGVLVWMGGASPKEATLMNPARWDKLASWTLPRAAPKPAAKPTPKSAPKSDSKKVDAKKAPAKPKPKKP